MESFVHWDATSAASPSKENMESMEIKVSRRRFALYMSQFLVSESPALRELTTEQTVRFS